MEQAGTDFTIAREEPLMYKRLFSIALAVFSFVLVLSCDKDKNTLDPGIEAELREIVRINKEEFGIPGIIAGV